MHRRLKSVEECLAGAERTGLRRTFGPLQLMFTGVGAVIGTGIFVLTAVGAERAGPALLLSFMIAGVVCGFAALAYSELAAMVPVSGSAYTYSYVVIGEAVAWLVGWNLILEYAVAAAAVAVGWSSYMAGLLKSAGLELPLSLRAGVFAAEGGGVNVLALLVVVVATALLVLGTRASARFTLILVAIKLAALLAFIVIAAPQISWDNFQPFMPFGFQATQVDGISKGVMAAAALLFFAYVGFDAVSTAAEETRNPQRNVPLGLIGALVICTAIYLGVAGAAVGTTPYTQLAGNTEPLASILRSLGFPMVGNLVALAAIVALPSVVLMMMYGQTRIFFAMSRDGLLPGALSRVHPRFHTPHIVTAVTGTLVAIVSSLFSLDEIAELSNTGTLFAFVVVAVAVLVMRRTQPDRPRPFRCPAPWLVCTLAVVGCCYLFVSLPRVAQSRFLIWTAIGLLVYATYGYRRSLLARA